MLNMLQTLETFIVDRKKVSNLFLMPSHCKVLATRTSASCVTRVVVDRRKEGKKEAQPSGSSSSIDTVDTASVTTADDEASSQSDSMPVPQLKVGPDGNIVLNTDR